MVRIALAAGALWAALCAAVWAQDAAGLMDQAMVGNHRAEANKARDKYRHPKETLLFFGLRPDMAVVEISPGSLQVAPPGSADLVLTFRNVHNWARAGTAEAMFKAFYDALKSAGTLGVVEHCAKPEPSFQQQIDTGYMTEAYVVETAQKAGFKLVNKSEINSNPKDTKDYPGGVWTLPPTLRYGDQDRDIYLAIGESDRMTLKFTKP
jgi:predicted methyltransferase